jgi:hypothetical protein|tara:strand:- start:71 stop:181 length:111 start_codon:yes stop_codon:yes gene_type:complete
MLTRNAAEQFSQNEQAFEGHMSLLAKLEAFFIITTY